MPCTTTGVYWLQHIHGRLHIMAVDAAACRTAALRQDAPSTCSPSLILQLITCTPKQHAATRHMACILETKRAKRMHTVPIIAGYTMCALLCRSHPRRALSLFFHQNVMGCAWRGQPGAGVHKAPGSPQMSRQRSLICNSSPLCIMSMLMPLVPC